VVFVWRRGVSGGSGVDAAAAGGVALALVFSGAKRLIERCRPEILFEINGPACDALGLDRRQAWDLLEQMGYRFCSVGPDGGLQHLDAPRDGNVLALARSDP